jgi:hypothetical protein
MRELDLNAKPASSVKEVLSAIDPTVEIVEGELNRDFYSFNLQSSNAKRTTAQVRCNLLSDLDGKYNAHLYRELKEILRNAINRMG